MGRTNFGAKPIMFPQPVLIIGTYDENGVPNAMNAAWGITTDFKEITISLSKHKTTDNLMARKAFTVSMATKNHHRHSQDPSHGILCIVHTCRNLKCMDIDSLYILFALQLLIREY